MLEIYFGKIREGRLQRLSFLGHSFLLIFVFMAIVFGIIALIAGAESFMGDNVLETQDNLRRTLGFPFFLIFAALIASIVFANLNIAAKRARDIGWPGWLYVLAVTIVGAIASMIFSQDAGQTIYLLSFVVLVLVPSGQFMR